MQISTKAKGISPSLTLAITAKANELREQGKHIIGFGAGEPDFITPQYICDGAKKAIDEGKTKYTPSSGILPLKKAIAAKLMRDNNLSYETSQIVISSGAKHSIFNALFAMLNEGDEVIIPAPYWLTYPELVNICGGKCVFVYASAQNDYKITPAQLEAAITSKTKLLIFNSPSNPTGAVYSEKEIREIGKVVEKAGIAVLADEIYEKLVYEGEKHFSIACCSQYLKDNTVLINGVSKSYAMTGWRIGYMAADKAFIKAVDSLQSQATSNASSISQYAALTALEGNDDEIEKMRFSFDKRRKLIISEIRRLPYVTCTEPKGAFYVMVDVSALYGKSIDGKTLNDSLDVAASLLEFGAAVVPGVAFGAPECVRLSYAISEQNIIDGIKCVGEFIAALK